MRERSITQYKLKRKRKIHGFCEFNQTEQLESFIPYIFATDKHSNEVPAKKFYIFDYKIKLIWMLWRKAQCNRQKKIFGVLYEILETDHLAIVLMYKQQSDSPI